MRLALLMLLSASLAHADPIACRVGALADSVPALTLTRECQGVRLAAEPASTSVAFWQVAVVAIGAGELVAVEPSPEVGPGWSILRNPDGPDGMWLVQGSRVQGILLSGAELVTVTALGDWRIVDECIPNDGRSPTTFAGEWPAGGCCWSTGCGSHNPVDACQPTPVAQSSWSAAKAVYR